MFDFKHFRVEEVWNGESYKVQVKGLFGWQSGYASTRYFLMNYDTREAALKSIEGYKNRFTYVNGDK